MFQGEISVVEEVSGNFLINKSAEQAPAEAEEQGEEEKKGENIDDILKNSFKSRKAF